MRLILKKDNPIGKHSKTHQRQLLLDIIRRAEGHLDARELLRRAMEQDTAISHATVYRNLNLFRNLGLIESKRFGKAQCYYEVKHAAEHQHLVCRHCGKVIDFSCPLKDILGKVKAEHGFTVTKAEVYLEGYCSDCREKENTER